MERGWNLDVNGLVFYNLQIVKKMLRDIQEIVIHLPLLIYLNH